MIIHGRITNVSRMELNDGAVLYKVFFTDASKPFEFRSETQFLTYLTEEKRKVLPSGDQIDGQEITVVATTFKGSDGTVSVKGQVVPGIVSPEQLTGGKLPTKPTPKAA